MNNNRAMTAVAVFPSSEAEARLAFECLGIERAVRTMIAVKAQIDDVARRGQPDTGEGFWDAQMSFLGGEKRRVVHFGHGEHVKCHAHDEDEEFVIFRGEADVYTWNNETRRWHHQFVSPMNKLTIPANVPHCLLVTDKANGLTMRAVNDDSRRKTVVEDCGPVPWE